MIIGPFCRLPAAHAASELDIMNEALGLVGAETFAAVDPKNNKKLEIDLWKLASRTDIIATCSLRRVGSPDRMTFTVALVVVSAMTLFAAWLPAHRATKVDPMAALRCD